MLYNRDYGNGSSPRHGEEARAGVALTARAVEAALRAIPQAEVTSLALDSPDELISALTGGRWDVAFNLCESLRGDPRYEIPVPVLLSSHGVPFTGNGPFALRTALDKPGARLLLHRQGVPIPAGMVVSDAAELEHALRTVPLPAIVKPAREDGSIGIDAGSVVRAAGALKRRVGYVRSRLKQAAIVEAFVEGREFNVSILGDASPVCLPLAEIDFSRMPEGSPRIVSYRAKWRSGTREYRGTVPVYDTCDEKLSRSIRRAALGAFRALALRDYARIDIRVDPHGHPFVIDINPNCDLSPDAGFPRAAAKAGISYSELIQRLVRFPLERAKRDASSSDPSHRSSLPV